MPRRPDPTPAAAVDASLLAAAAAIADAVEAAEGPMTPKKRSIVEAAVVCFAERGYEATPTIDIARRAGVAEGTIFRHFEGKKDLLLRLVRPLAANVIMPAALGEFADVVAEAKGDIETIMRTMLHRRIAFVRRHAPLVRILLQELPFHAELRALVGEQAIRFVAVAEPVLMEHAGASGLRPMQAIRLFASVAGGYLIFSSILAPDAGWDDEDEVNAIVQFLLRGYGIRS